MKRNETASFRARRRARLQLSHAFRVPIYGRVRRRIARVTRNAELAVVVHVYYPDMWPQLRDHLQRMTQPHDLFVTVPSRAVANVIHPSHARAVEVVPNVGRDVLPFLQVGRVLRDLGYSSVLKIHTKRNDRDSGSSHWRDSTLSTLVAQSGIEEVSRLLQLPDTGLIGVGDFYYSATTTEPDVLRYMSEIISALRPGSNGMERLAGVGFFAGTMFWARMDAISDLLDIDPRVFPREMGRVDGTPAHALERLFGVLPALDGRSNYVLTEAGLRRGSKETLAVPYWRR